MSCSKPIKIGQTGPPTGITTTTFPITRRFAAKIQIINNEEKDNFVILLKTWISWFDPNIFLTSQSRKTLFQSHKTSYHGLCSHQQNDIIQAQQEILCIFKNTLLKVLSHIWHQSISFPTFDSVMHVDIVLTLSGQASPWCNGITIGLFSCDDPSRFYNFRLICWTIVW